jgi:AmmeMemoRadiSam system protein A
MDTTAMGTAAGDPAPAGSPVRVADIAPEARRQLLRLARSAVEAAVRGEPRPVPSTEDLHPDTRRPFGAFVTITEHGDLRGCIGRLDFERPVCENVVDAAIASALDDPRFPSVRPRELDALELEVSVLDPPMPIDDPGAFDASRHGVMIERGWNRGLLLPVVARRYGWDERRTLEAVCDKAGLPRDAWRDRATRLYVFTAAELEESELQLAR